MPTCDRNPSSRFAPTDRGQGVAQTGLFRKRNKLRKPPYLSRGP